MWQGRFLQSHTPANPCSQSGPLLLLPLGAVPPGAMPTWPRTSFSPGRPALSCHFFWSGPFLQEGTRISSHSTSAAAHSLAACSSLHGVCRRQGRSSPGLCLWVFVGHPNLWDPRGSSALGKCSGDTKSCSVVSRGQMGRKRAVTGQQIW